MGLLQGRKQRVLHFEWKWLRCEKDDDDVDVRRSKLADGEVRVVTA